MIEAVLILASFNVFYYMSIGMVDHETLAEGFAAAGFILYPTTFPETGCITLMKAQAMGAIPITSRYRQSTLPELTGPYDLGPRQLQGRSITDDPAWVELWVEAVVEASNNDYQDRVGGGAGNREIHTLRQEMMRTARERFAWSSVARMWMDRFDEDKDLGWMERRRRRQNPI